MINKRILKLIENKEWAEALSLINLELDKPINLLDEEMENQYLELLHLRITAKYFLGDRDHVVLDHERMIKYPSNYELSIGADYKVKLVFKNAFQIKCDAYISNIPNKNYFVTTQGSSAENEFVRRVGLINIQSQIDTDKTIEHGKFVKLKHNQLDAPYSYHLSIYDENKKTNSDIIELAVNNVLDAVIKDGIKDIAFFAIGFDEISTLTSKEEKDSLADRYANSIAKSIVKYVYNHYDHTLPNITLAFVKVDSIITFIRAFEYWCKLSYKQIEQLNTGHEKAKILVNKMGTTNINFINDLKKIAYVIEQNDTILITGETGVGKSYLAKVIHDLSPRKDKNFLHLNCALIASQLIYSEIFGYEKGAHSEAKQPSQGIMGKVENGTLFLDEIGYSDYKFQRDMLTFIETKEYKRLGGSENIKANVRIILGTNIDLEAAIADGRFQHDLYERIAINQIHIPPLRERKEDIPKVIKSIEKELYKEFDRNIAISDHALEMIKSYNWPGNIRQLHNYLRLLYTICRNENKSQISRDLIEANYPRNTVSTYNNDFASLETSLKNIIKNWNEGDLVQKLIYPTIAKIYFEDLNLPKADAKKILGIDGKGKRSLLQRALSVYYKIKKRYTDKK